MNDVVAKLGLDDVAGFAFLQPERRLLEGLHHHSGRYHAEVAALLGGARILRILLRQLGKLDRGFLQLGQQRPGFLSGSLFLRRLGIGRRGYEDVADAALLDLLVLA